MILALSTLAYLANKPTGTTLAMLIIALVFFAAAVLATFAHIAPYPLIYATLIALGLVFFVLAFLVS